jgi:hypothetical protein
VKVIKEELEANINMKLLPDNWILLKDDKNDLVFSNKQRSHFVHIDYKEDHAEQFSIYFVQCQHDFMIIGTAEDTVRVGSKTQINAMEKAMLLMECIDEHLLRQLKNVF